MAMALSSTMAPAAAALGSQRRRRVSATATTNNSSANANAPALRRRRDGVTNANDATTNASGTATDDGDADAEGTRRAVRFARFDAVLQHSDQTLRMVGGNARAWRSSLAHAPPPFGLAATARARSSFFPDSTDDEDTSRTAAIGASGFAAFAPLQRDPRSAPRSSAPAPASSAPTPTPTPTFPVIHIGDVQFPTTRTVLWDRRVLAGPFQVATADVLPRVRLTNAVLKQLHAAAVDKSHSLARLVGYATSADAAASPDQHDDDRTVVLSTLAHHKAEGERSRNWWVPMYRGRPSHQEDDSADQEEMETAARAKYESTSGTSSNRRGVSQLSVNATLPVEARGFVCVTAERSHAEIDVEIDVAVPLVALQFRLIRSLPLLMTPLAASLLRCEFGAEIRRFGYLTLDRARKAVPLLETDPLVLQRPIVGLWVYGIDVDDSSAAESIHVRHPYLFESCVRFLSSKLIKERAQVDADTFLVAVYPGSTAGPLPRFFECHASRAALSSSVVEWTSASARGRCLAGVASYKTDLELIPVLVLERVQRSTRSEEVTAVHAPRDTAERTVPTWQERSYHNETRRSTTNGTFSHGTVEQAAPLESKSMRSCCRSQQILASHHQQMLENQQRQLRDLQEQIAQLQRVLSDTRAENARLLAASSSRSSGSSHVGDEVGQGHERASLEAHDDAGIDSPAESPMPEDDGDQLHEEPNSLENDTSMVSSLALSSISAGSHASELSSVSSSLVGSRLKTLLTTELADDESTPAPEGLTVPEEATKLAGSPREPQTVSEIANQEPLRVGGDDTKEGGVSDDDDDSDGGVHDDGSVRRTCPFVPSICGNNRRRAQCERDEFEDESDASKIDELLAERLRLPNTPNREEIVRGGSLATFGFSHGSSFSIPKIKYVPEIVTCDSDDDEEEEIRRIELKYRSSTRRAH